MRLNVLPLIGFMIMAVVQVSKAQNFAPVPAPAPIPFPSNDGQFNSLIVILIYLCFIEIFELNILVYAMKTDFYNFGIMQEQLLIKG